MEKEELCRLCGWDCVFRICIGPVIVRGDVKVEDSLGLGHVEAHAEECPQCSNEASLKRKVFRVCVVCTILYYTENTVV